LSCQKALGQSGTKGELSGKVVDAVSGEELIGANVIVKPAGADSTSLVGTITDVNGRFSLNDVPLGRQILLVSYIGYAKTEVSVNVQQGILATITVKLQANAEQLEEVVVRAAADVRYSSIRNSTDLQLLSSIKFSEGMLAGISNEQIVKSADRDASQIVQRISGVSLVDRFVVVRGMDTRYNLTMVNGIIGPSSEENSRAFSFDALPSGVIDRIELEKSPMAHLPAMWGGGVVKIFTRSFAKARQFNFDFTGGYRTGGSSFNDQFVTYDAGSKDWYANGAADRRLPAILRQPYFIFPDFGKYPVENISLARSGIKSFAPTTINHTFDKRVNASYYDSWKVGNLTLNNLTAASYTNERVYLNVHQTRNSANFQNAETTGFGALFIDSTRNESGVLYYREYPTLDAVDSTFIERVRVSVVESIGLQFSEVSNLSATLFYNRFGTDQTTIRKGFDDIYGSGDEPQKDLTYYTYAYEQREILLGQLGGSHLFGRNSIDWTAGYAITRNETPNFQQFLFQGTGDYASIVAGLDNEGNRSFQTYLVFETEEHSLTGRLDYKREIKEGFYMKLGALYDRRERSAFSYRYLPLNVNGTEGNYFSEAVYQPWNNMDSVYSLENFSTDQWYLDLPSKQGGAYFFDDESAEGYAAVNYPIIKDKLSFYGGMRVARFSRTLYDQFNQPTLDSARLEGMVIKVPDRVKTYYLPSAMIKAGFKGGKYIIRGVYGQTVDRPQFREQAGASSVEPGGATQSVYDFRTNESLLGNPGLENSLIHSADLRFEFYPKGSEFISIGGFYKYIDKPIQRIAEDLVGSVVRIRYNNGKYAEALGVELEVRKKFDFLSVPVLKDISMNLNASYIVSESTVNFSKPPAPGEDTIYIPDVTFKLQGASPFLINAALYYENLDKGTLVSLIYNLTWDRVRDYSADIDIGNLLEGKRGQLDIVVKQRITDFLTLKASVTNLLDPIQRYYRDQDASYTYQPGINNSIPLAPDNPQSPYRGDFAEREFRTGAYYTLGLAFTLQNNKE
jgi:hypothetical protein